MNPIFQKRNIVGVIAFLFAPYFGFCQKKETSCIPSLIGKTGASMIKMEELLEAAKIDFPAGCNDSIISYSVSYAHNGEFKTIKLIGATITPDLKKAFGELKSKQRIIIEDIVGINFKTQKKTVYASIVLKLE